MAREGTARGGGILSEGGLSLVGAAPAALRARLPRCLRGGVGRHERMRSAGTLGCRLCLRSPRAAKAEEPAGSSPLRHRCPERLTERGRMCHSRGVRIQRTEKKYASRVSGASRNSAATCRLRSERTGSSDGLSRPDVRRGDWNPLPAAGRGLRPDRTHEPTQDAQRPKACGAPLLMDPHPPLGSRTPGPDRRVSPPGALGWKPEVQSLTLAVEPRPKPPPA